MNRAEVLQTLVALGMTFNRENMPNEALAIRTAVDLLGFSESEAESGDLDTTEPSIILTGSDNE